MATMSPKDFRRWRKVMDLSQKDAAEALGLKRRVVQYYEKGERDGEKVDIPKYVRLACFALLQGVKDYKGPPKEDADETASEVACLPESDTPEPVATEGAPPADLAAPLTGDGKRKPAKTRAKGAGRQASAKASAPQSDADAVG